jgi:hypothetical protein
MDVSVAATSPASKPITTSRPVHVKAGRADAILQLKDHWCVDVDSTTLSFGTNPANLM